MDDAVEVGQAHQELSAAQEDEVGGERGGVYVESAAFVIVDAAVDPISHVLRIAGAPVAVGRRVGRVACQDSHTRA